MRRAGVGDGLAEGSGVGVGVCANVLSGSFVATSPAAPSAGSSFTNDRRLFEVFGFGSASTVAELGFFRFTVSPSHPGNICNWDGLRDSRVGHPTSGDHRSVSDTLRTSTAVLELNHFGFAKPVNRHDEKIVVFAFRNNRKAVAA